MKVPAHAIDSLHSLLMDDDAFMDAVQRCAYDVAESVMAAQPCETDEDDIMELAWALVNRVSVS